MSSTADATWKLCGEGRLYANQAAHTLVQRGTARGVHRPAGQTATPLVKGTHRDAGDSGSGDLMAPPTKPPGQLRRRNPESKWQLLDPTSTGMEAPPLPDRDGGWSDRTLEWWQTIWASPMAILWLPADMGALHDLAELRERISRNDHRMGGMGAVRAIEDRLGLTPKSRALLKWMLPTYAGTAHPEEPPAPPEPDKPTRQASVTRLRAVDSG